MRRKPALQTGQRASSFLISLLCAAGVTVPRHRIAIDIFSGLISSVLVIAASGPIRTGGTSMCNLGADPGFSRRAEVLMRSAQDDGRWLIRTGHREPRRPTMSKVIDATAAIRLAGAVVSWREKARQRCGIDRPHQALCEARANAKHE